MTHVEKRLTTLGNEEVTGYFMVSDDGGEYPIGYSEAEAQAYLDQMAARSEAYALSLKSSSETVDSKVVAEDDKDKKDALEKDAEFLLESEENAKQSKAFFEGLTIPD